MGIEESLLNTVHVPRGTVCFQCVHGDSVVTVGEYRINNMTADSVDGVMVVNGTLVFTNSESIFNAVSPTQVWCSNSRVNNSILVYYDCEFIPMCIQCLAKENIFLLYVVFPTITGETSVNEGDTLELYCNVSQSNPPATVHWLSPNGYTSDGGVLEIVNITRSWMGLYFCIASFNNSNITKNSSVEVVIQCKCMKCL